MAREVFAWQENLTYLIKNVLQSAEYVAASSEELTAASQQAGQAANETAGTVQDIAGGACVI